VQLSIEGFDTMSEEQADPANQPAPATPDRVQSVVEETPAKKVTITETVAEMISKLANHKTRSIEVSRGHNEETQAIIFPPRTRNEVSFLDQARRSGWIDDITPEQHHRRGMLMYFSKYWSADFDDIAREERNLKRTHTMETYTTESMIRNCSLTGQQFKEIKGTLLARSNVLMKLNVEKLKELESIQVLHSRQGS
jgi:hypothetical protein